LVHPRDAGELRAQLGAIPPLAAVDLFGRDAIAIHAVGLEALTAIRETKGPRRAAVSATTCLLRPDARRDGRNK
jgi:hypothetical protein